MFRVGHTASMLPPSAPCKRPFFKIILVSYLPNDAASLTSSEPSPWLWRAEDPIDPILICLRLIRTNPSLVPMDTGALYENFDDLNLERSDNGKSAPVLCLIKIFLSSSVLLFSRSPCH